MNKFSLIGLVGIMGIILSCTTHNQKEKKEIYQVVNPVIRDMDYINEYVAEINAIQNVELRSLKRGYLQSILVDEGQRVHKGQVLFKIKSDGVLQEVAKTSATIKTMQAELKSAEIELETARRLFDKKIIGRPEYDLAIAKMESLKAKVDEAKSVKAQASIDLSQTNIVAPFSGIINRIPNKLGSLIEEGTLLTSISNNSEMYVYFNMSEMDYLNYAIKKQDGNDKEVSLILANGINYIHKGKIETTESQFDKSTGNIAFRAKFPNPENLLKHGGSGKVQVKTTVPNAMVIPQKSSFEIQENIYVYVVSKDSVVQKKLIKPLYTLRHYFIVDPKLDVREKILYEGIQKVKEGDKISFKTIPFIIEN